MLRLRPYYYALTLFFLLIQYVYELVFTNLALFLKAVAKVVTLFKSRKFILIIFMRVFEFWWAMRDSNPRPPRCKRGALNQLS